jgi:3-oxoacyl-ACP reductase-like protein
LGLTNYLRQYIPAYSEHVKGLFDLLKMTNKGKKFMMGENKRNLFQRIKKRVLEAKQLHKLNFEKLLGVCTDASKVAIGGSIFQSTTATGNSVLNPDGESQIDIICFYSKILKESESNYTTIGFKLFAIICIM